MKVEDYRTKGLSLLEGNKALKLDFNVDLQPGDRDSFLELFADKPISGVIKPKSDGGCLPSSYFWVVAAGETYYVSGPLGDYNGRDLPWLNELALELDTRIAN